MRTRPENVAGQPAETREWVVHTSPARTLIARRGADGDTVLLKLFETGSLAEARREVAFGRLLEGCGIVRHRDALVDPSTGKVAVVVDHHDGLDLEEWIGQHGPMPPRVAASIGLQLARTLVHFADHRSEGAPNGFVHRDVKPSNVLLVGDERAPENTTALLLDLEHALPLGPPDAAPEIGSGFSGGTHGFAPPEAYLGRAPNAGFDVFGFGCTLHFALVGSAPFDARDEPGRERAIRQDRWRRAALSGSPDSIRELIEACLAPDPADRPTLDAVVDRLRDHLARPLTEVERRRDETLRRALRGDFDLENETLDPEAGELRRLLERRRRFLDRLGPPADLDETREPGELARALATGAPRLVAFLRRFPLHARALELRRRTLHAAVVLLEHLLPEVAARRRAAHFAAAEELIEDARTAMLAISRLGRRPLDHLRSTQLAPILRDPFRTLDSSHKDLVADREHHAGLLRRLRDAEARLDAGGATNVLQEFAAVYGGASEVVATLKDERHRLEFYLARLAQQRPLLRDLRDLCDSASVTAELDELADFLDRCGRVPPAPEFTSSENENVRTLQRSLRDVARDFPHLRDAVEPAVASLERTLNDLSRRAWGFLDDARRKLVTPPIPIRPLQSFLSRLDNMRLLDALVDLPDRPRAQILDEIETLRTRLQEARAKRDRMTRGAREAMDRGHWTTALYDMGRAVDQFGDEGEGDLHREGPRLAEQFEEAKRRKQSLEDALVDNHRLAKAYAELSGDPESSSTSRVAVLREREHVLSYLCTNLGADRIAPFADDLRAVESDLLREHSVEGERRLENATSPEQELAVIHQTLELIQSTAPEQAQLPEVRTLLAGWRARLIAANDAVRAHTEAAIANGGGLWRRVLSLFRRR